MGASISARLGDRSEHRGEWLFNNHPPRSCACCSGRYRVAPWGSPWYVRARGRHRVDPVICNQYRCAWAASSSRSASETSTHSPGASAVGCPSPQQCPYSWRISRGRLTASRSSAPPSYQTAEPSGATCIRHLPPLRAGCSVNRAEVVAGGVAVGGQKSQGIGEGTTT
jgi:hypothetical protein